MKRIVYFVILILISCRSANTKNDIVITQKKLDKPLKLVYNSKENDSSYIYLCFPKMINIDNQTNKKNIIENFHVGQHHKGINVLHYKAYEYTDKLKIKRDITFDKNEKTTFNLYYGYLLKIPNTMFDSLTGSQKEKQILPNFEITKFS